MLIKHNIIVLKRLLYWLLIVLLVSTCIFSGCGLAESGDDAGNSYSVINSGESYLGELGFVFDNFPIKVYIDVK